MNDYYFSLQEFLLHNYLQMFDNFIGMICCLTYVVAIIIKIAVENVVIIIVVDYVN